MSEDYRSLGKPIEKTSEGLRLDLFLAKEFLFHSRHRWAKKIEEGEVLVSGRPVTKPSYRLKLSEQISYYHPITREPEVQRELPALWQDSSILAVFKPSGLPMHEAGAYRINTFERVLKETYGPQWAAVHRLDRETSGIVLCGNSMEIRGSLSASLRDLKWQKTYLAITKEIPHDLGSEWIIDAPIGPIEQTLFREKLWVTDKGANALTYVRLLEKGQTYGALLEIQPKTGRTHQIRIHSAYKGFPLVGEKKYQKDETIYLHYLEHGFDARVQACCLYERLCLHAHRLEFPHPVSLEKTTVESPMPLDMRDIWSQLCAIQ